MEGDKGIEEGSLGWDRFEHICLNAVRNKTIEREGVRIQEKRGDNPLSEVLKKSLRRLKTLD